MTIFAMIVFGISLVGVVSLFVLKHWETGSGRILAPALRAKADGHAMQLKHRIYEVRVDLARIPPLLVLYARYLVHEGALGFAGFARKSEASAHRLADLVSHKRSFVPREPRSEFLKKVSSRKKTSEDQ